MEPGDRRARNASSLASVDLSVAAPEKYDLVGPGRSVEARSLLDGRRLTHRQAPRSPRAPGAWRTRVRLMIHPNAHRAARAFDRAGGNASSGEIVDAKFPRVGGPAPDDRA